MDFPYGEMVTLRSTVSTTDDHGDTTEVVTDVPWGPCAVAPRTSSETTDPHAPAVIVGLTIYGPEVEIHADDTVLIRGEVYQVEGVPGSWRSPFTGWAPGLEVAVRRAS